VTGFTNRYNLLVASNSSQPEFKYFYSYVDQPEVRQALHIKPGMGPFRLKNPKVLSSLKKDYVRSVKHLYEQLLDAPEGYRVLLFSGQLDLAVPYTATENMIYNMEWGGKEAYVGAKKTIWRSASAGGQGKEEILGFAKTANNFTHLLIRNAGHRAPFDQPEVLFKMITTFTAGKAFDS